MYGGDFEMGAILIMVGRFDQVPTKCMQKNNVTQQL